jgi:phosphate transport system permease protein
MTAAALLISAPAGIFAAIYLAEYAGRGNKFVPAVRLAAETLSGIPSVVYGMFGRLLFVSLWGVSLIAGSFTLAIMTLPLIMRTTQEALMSVPDIYREGSFGLGAGRLRTVFAVTLPSAAPGILAGVILAVGRIVGETAALILTSGTVADMPRGIFSSARTLSVHMYVLANEALYTNQAYASAFVLLILVVAINACSGAAAGRLAGGRI